MAMTPVAEMIWNESVFLVRDHGRDRDIFSYSFSVFASHAATGGFFKE
jgi:hypothetical protein